MPDDGAGKDGVRRTATGVHLDAIFQDQASPLSYLFSPKTGSRRICSLHPPMDPDSLAGSLCACEIERWMDELYAWNGGVTL